MRKKRAVISVPMAERVSIIATLMSDGRYEGAATRLELMAKWGCSDTVVKQAAAEAHRQLAADPEEVVHLKASLGAFCARMREQAATRRNKMTGLSDVQAALKAAELQAKFMGIEILDPKRVELAGPGGGPVVVSLEAVDAALKAAEQNAEPDTSAGPRAEDSEGDALV